MRTPTMEELLRTPTPEAADAAMRNVAAGKVRRCIPAQVDDDDVVLSAVVEDWKRLRRAALSLPPDADPEADPDRWECDRCSFVFHHVCNNPRPAPAAAPGTERCPECAGTGIRFGDVKCKGCGGTGRRGADGGGR
jgi:hypothetical protein